MRHASGFYERRDAARERATPLQRNVVEIQAAKFELLLFRLLERSGDDPELASAINAFLDCVDNRSRKGSPWDTLPRPLIEQLTRVFQSATLDIQRQTGKVPPEV